MEQLQQLIGATIIEEKVDGKLVLGCQLPEGGGYATLEVDNVAEEDITVNLVDQ